MDEHFEVVMCNCEVTLIQEIAMPEMTRNSLALTYAFAIRSGEAVNWEQVNKAIIERWSRSALEYIKQRAWGIVEGRVQV